MKIIKSKLFPIMAYLLGISYAIAGPHPPPPNGKRPPPPPGLPINENLFVLAILAILLGIYIIYKYQLKTKTPT